VNIRKKLEMLLLRQSVLFFVLSCYEQVTVQPLLQAATDAAAHGGALASALGGKRKYIQFDLLSN